MTAQAPSQARPTTAPTGTRATLIMAACCIGQFMIILDVSVVNVALPVINQRLHFQPNSLQWVINSYTIVFCGFLLLGGRLADFAGHRRAFLVGTGILICASLFGGLAYSATTLVVGRAFQGLGAAVMGPATLTILGTTFRLPAQRARAFGLWGAVAGTAGAIGVLAGGLIVQFLSWRWVLLINVPIGVLLFALATRCLPADRRATPGGAGRLDLTGVLCVTVSLMTLVYGAAEGGRYGWTATPILVALTTSAALFGLFLLDQARLARQPLVPLGVFRNRSVSAANATALLSSGALLSMFYFIALLLQQVMGLSPMQTGLAYLPLSLGIFAGARGVSRLVPRFGARPILVAGLVLSALGLASMSLADQHATFVANVLGPTVLLGVGQGMVVTASAIAATAGLPRHLAGLGSGLLGTTRQLGGAVGLVVLVAIANARTGVAAGTGSPARSALAAGYDLAFLVAAGFALAALGAALAIPGRAPASAAGQAPDHGRA